MSNYPELGLPQAWKPLFRAMNDHGWELAASLPPAEEWESAFILHFEQGGESCYLSFFHEPEWCGNNRQSLALTIAGLSEEFPEGRNDAEEHMLLLTGDWETAVTDFVATFSQIKVQKHGLFH